MNDSITWNYNRAAAVGAGRAVENYRIAFTVTALSEKFTRHVGRKSPELSDFAVHLE